MGRKKQPERKTPHTISFPPDLEQRINAERKRLNKVTGIPISFPQTVTKLIEQGLSIKMEKKQ